MLPFSRFHIILLAALIAATACAQSVVGPPPSNAPSARRSAATELTLLADRARRAEQMGDYNRALSIWKEVLNRAPWNMEAVPAVPRNLIVLKKYDEAEAFLNDYIQKNAFRADVVISPADPTSVFSLKLLLGQVALAEGHEPAAWDIWNAALKEAQGLPDAVRALVILLQQNRRWEESGRIIRDFRKDANQPAFMALELAMSLRGQMDYAAAVEELIVYADNTPSGWQISANYLNQFPDDSAAAAKINAVLRKAISRDKKNVTIWRLFAGYAHKSGRAAEAVDATITADSLSASGGTLLLSTAQQLLQEGSVEEARRAFQKVLAWKPPADVTARAELGLGQCYEALGQWPQARESYQAFTQKYPAAKEADEARYRIGLILLDRDRNASEALTVFRGLLQKPQGVSRAQVALRIGDCHAWLSELDNAIQSWSDVVKMSGQQISEDGAQALLRIARANLWRDSTSRALDMLDSIQAGNPANTSFNDAILYSQLLGEGGFHGAVQLFAGADYASFRHEDSLAAEKYSAAADLLKAGKLAEWARLCQADALRSAGRAAAAIAVLDTFIVTYTGSVDLDRAKYTRAVIRMDDLKDSAGALEEFQNFLIEHPRSIYLEQARRRARILTARVS